MKTALIDRVPGQVVTADGTQDRPATILTAEAALILRNYFYWALTQQLEPELFCAACYDGTRQSRAQHDIGADKIAIVCGCQIRFFQGAAWTKPAAPCAPSTVASRGESAEALHVRLSADAAALLRQWKRVMIDLGLREAVRCNACFALDQPDGCDAQVLTSSIRIRCRCSDRTFQGMSV